MNVSLKVDTAIDGYMRVAEMLGAALVQTLDKPLRGLEVRSRGDLATYDTRPLAVAALKGALAKVCEQPVNVVNVASSQRNVA